MVANNDAGTGTPVTLTLNWGGVGGALSVCTLQASSSIPTTGSLLNMTASCNNSPSKIEWLECNYMIQDICVAIPSCTSGGPAVP